MSHHIEIGPQTRAIAKNVLLHTLDDHVVCFSRDTGTTHVLDALSGEVLQQLLRKGSPQSEQALREHLAQAMSVEPDSINDNVIAALRTLCSEHLIALRQQ